MSSDILYNIAHKDSLKQFLFEQKCILGKKPIQSLFKNVQEYTVYFNPLVNCLND